MASQIHQALRVSCMLTAPIVMTFQSQKDLQNALSPHSIEEVESVIASSSTPLTFQYCPDPSGNKTAPIRNFGANNLLKHQVFQSEDLTVYYPEIPRTPHHLIVAFNRENVKGITDVSEEENQALFTTIKKITEIYKSVHIIGFVIAEYDRPQQDHLNRYVIEIIPHLPGFSEIKNIADKVDCNRYVLFRHANISPVICKVAQEEIEANARFWKQAFAREISHLTEEDIKITFPYYRYEAYNQEAQVILQQHLIEILQDKGGQTAQPFPTPSISIPMDVPDSPKVVEVKRCPFCDPTVLQKQCVFEYNGIAVLYNMRKGAKPGCTFLVLPTRHNEKVYGLSEQEIHNISVVKKALVAVLKESHPGHEVVIYIQDGQTVGQTVFHFHEQVVSINPDTIALSWTLMSLHPSGNVTDDEMLQVKEDFGSKIAQKIKELTDLEEAL